MFSIFFLNLAFYEIMWKITVEPDRPQITIWRIPRWIPKGTHTLTIRNTHYFSTTTMVARMHLIVTFYVH